MTSRHDRYPRAARRLLSAFARAAVSALVLAALAPGAPAAGAQAPAKAEKAVAQPSPPARPGARDRQGAGPAANSGAVRTLDAIQIEGEIAVPQVLFITARDFRRFRDGVGLAYQPSVLDVARAVTLPVRLRVVASHEMTKEEGR